MRLIYSGASALALLACGGGASAQTAPAGDVSEVIVTGTRQTGLRAVDSPQPVQVVGASALLSAGEPSLRKALALNVPSFQAQALGGNEAGVNLAIRMRGLNPNHTLVLVDGKRRLTSASLSVSAGAFQGGASADLNFIPVEAIERVEVLQNGAAAQYGSDAVAGVVNIILKRRDHGGSLSGVVGKYFDGGGETAELALNFGAAPRENTWVNLTLEDRYHGSSNRSGLDARVVGAANLARNPTVVNFPGYPNVNVSKGDAQLHVQNLVYTAGVDLTEHLTLYSQGTYGRKHGWYTQTYRLPSVAPSIFPNGFNPSLNLKEEAFEVAFGLKGRGGAYVWDLHTRYGDDTHKLYTTNTVNQSLLIDRGFSPTDFYDGGFRLTSWVTQLDVTRDLAVGWTTPLTLAFGGQARLETYEIRAGEPGSYYKTGAQSFPGFQPASAGENSRENYAGYVNIAGSPVAALQIDLAARYEHFSEFGDTTVGKITARYDVSPRFAVRGTASTGFRAPTLPEEHYTSILAGPTSGSVQLAPNSPAAERIGLRHLRPEKSRNFSAGWVYRNGAGLVATLDAYQISISDRIVGTGAVFCRSPSAATPTSAEVCAAIAAAGVTFDPGVTSQSLQVFNNQLSTRTRGVDAVINVPQSLGERGTINWSITGTYNETKITRQLPNPPSFPPGVVLLNPNALSIIEDQSPKFQGVIAAVWRHGRLTVDAREVIYGPSHELRSFNGRDFYKTEVTTKALTNLEIAYQLRTGVVLAIGANNLFNVYPNRVNPTLYEQFRAGNSDGTSRQYPDFSPVGINGGYYYGRFRLTF